MSKKIGWVIFTILIALSLVLSACAGAPATQVPAPTEAPAMTEAPVATEETAKTEAPTEVMTEEPTEAPTEEPTEEPMAGAIDCMGAQSGDEVTMFYQWSGTEEEQLMAIFQPLVDACGITLAPEASRDQALLDTRIQAGTPP